MLFFIQFFVHFSHGNLLLNFFEKFFKILDIFPLQINTDDVHWVCECTLKQREKRWPHTLLTIDYNG